MTSGVVARVRHWLRWFVRHGAGRLTLLAGVVTGSSLAQIMFNFDGRTDPFPLYERLRNAGVVSGNAIAMATAGYAGVAEVLRNARFTASPASSPVARWALDVTSDPAAVASLDPPSLLVVDPPDHTRYRRLIAPAFSARAVERMRPRIEAIVAGVLDDLAARPREQPVDLVQAFSKQVPVAVISDLMGTPPEMTGQFLDWTDRGAPSLDMGLPYGEYTAADAAIREANTWLLEHFERLRADPGPDLISSLVAPAGDEEPLTDTELLATVQLLLSAGFVTMVDALSSGVVLLLDHPEQLAELRHAPAGWDNAFEEILRIESPVQYTARFAGPGAEVGGCPVASGRAVVAMLGGANRDPSAFPGPDVFDIHRANARDHLAFSRGIHHCVGAGLARLEGTTALRALFERFPEIVLEGPPERRGGAMLRGYRHLWVTL